MENNSTGYEKNIAKRMSLSHFYLANINKDNDIAKLKEFINSPVPEILTLSDGKHFKFRNGASRGQFMKIRPYVKNLNIDWLVKNNYITLKSN